MTRTPRALAALVALTLGVVVAGPAPAQDAEIDSLRQAVHDLQSQLEEIEDLQDQLEDLEAAQAASGGMGDEPAIKVGPGLSISRGEESFQLTGRLHWDVGFYPSEQSDRFEDFDSGTNLRRGRLGARGASGGYSYNLTIDVGSSARESGDTVAIAEAAIYYTPSTALKFGFGKMKVPVTFEESTSANDISFIERSMPVDMFTDKTIGPKSVNAQVWIYGERSLIEAAIHAGSDTTLEGFDGGAEDIGFTGRVVYAPIRTSSSALHLGGWADRSSGPVGGAGDARWGYRTELNVADAKLLYGNNVSDLDSMTHWGLELAYLRGPFWAQAEYVSGTMARTGDAKDVEGDGFYVQAGYVIGGAKRYSMAKGAWSAPRVANPFPGQGAGVVELAARYSTVDFGVDPDVTSHAGSQTNLTLGVNWYLSDNSRIMFNSIRVDLDDAYGGAPISDAADAVTNGVTDSFWVHGIRWQYKW